ncbi:unnamed protein product [Medioppia subpectinata]|uniref:Uncharacterized protein n=1 Tax=Medioppia subpectinata TaxID=1979941 RepID=A0A7R9KMY1_9ACAR|nr:unnamed protein product [Medioppia subpectinata]CAG2106549.1 unnamed protein product [Medioppia subpectinata]
MFMGESRNFTGRVVLVTGSNSGIGEGIVKLFAILGANVVVTGRNVTRINNVVNECRKISPQSLEPLGIAADLTKSDELANLIDSTIKHFGKLNVLVNNAGQFLPLTKISSDNLLAVHDQIFAINLRAIVELIHRSVPHLKRTRGSIINTASISGIIPSMPHHAYSPTKAGVITLTKALGLELGPMGIRINSISPGVTQSRNMPAEFLTHVIEFTPVGRPENTNDKF